MEKPKYLVRPDDFHIFEIDDINGCYRPYVTRDSKNRPSAYDHFTFENLTKNFKFFPIREDEFERYKLKHGAYIKYISWCCRPDGHGGSKGGSLKEYVQRGGIDYEKI